MGGKAKTRNTNKDASATMDRLSKGRVSNDRVMSLQERMAGNQLAEMIPIFEAMMNQGQQSFNSNPIFGGQQPQPPGFAFGPMPQPPAANMSPDNRTGGSLGDLQQVPGQPVYTGPQGGLGGGGMTLEDFEFIRSGGRGMIPRGRQ